MEIVYKYELNAGWNALQLPGNPDTGNRLCGPAILDVAFQGDTLVMWVRVDLERETNMRMFYCAMTGQALPAGDHHIGEYVGTATNSHGIVVHVFGAYAKDAQ
jgi:hypothetical protein